MSKKYYLFLLVSLGLLLLVTQNSFAQSEQLSQNNKVSGTATSAVFYPMPNCGCCGSYGKYLGQHGFTLHKKKISDTKELKKIAKQDNVPLKYRKQPMGMHTGICHITEIGSYTVIGHVPVNIIQRLLKQQPKNIAGIILPGMPMGSPGMGMNMKISDKKREPLVIYAFNKKGKSWVYAKLHDTPPYTPIK